MKIKKVKTEKLFKQPSYKDYMNQKDVLTIGTGKEIQPLDTERNKKIIKKERKDYGI